jgi:hypothetical protein
MMEGEHGAVLSSWKWIKEVARAVEDVAEAGRRWDEDEDETDAEVGEEKSEEEEQD